MARLHSIFAITLFILHIPFLTQGLRDFPQSTQLLSISRDAACTLLKYSHCILLMSTVRRRPSIFSYFSFSKEPAGSRHGRSDSVTANLRQDDPYEKADRHSSSGDSGSRNGSMTQGPRSRLFKVFGIVGLFLLALWLIAPAGSRENAKKLLHGETCLDHSYSLHLSELIAFSRH